jgi:putative ABC transport system permease protein
LRSHLAEYAVLALLTSFISLLIGSLAAWIVVAHVMDIDFAFSGWAAVQAMLVAAGLVALFGGFGTWRVLRAPPVPYLRSE